jgi:hypothetical protein
MKKYNVFFLLFIHFFSFGQSNEDQETLSKPYILFKNGMHYAVSKPVVVCENTCYYTDRFSKNSYSVPLDSVEGFSRGSDVRYMTQQEFIRIGGKLVKGYFLGVMTIYPTGLGIFIISDITKRRHIRNLYRFSIHG